MINSFWFSPFPAWDSNQWGDRESGAGGGIAAPKGIVETTAHIYPFNFLRWRQRSGCIEVLPVEASNPLMDTMISNFRVTEVDQTELANNAQAMDTIYYLLFCDNLELYRAGFNGEMGTFGEFCLRSRQAWCPRSPRNK